MSRSAIEGRLEHHRCASDDAANEGSKANNSTGRQAGHGTDSGVLGLGRATSNHQQSTLTHFARIAHLAEAEDELELEELELGAGAAVKMCPANEVVKPDEVARVIAGPPTEVISTSGTPLEAMKHRCNPGQTRSLLIQAQAAKKKILTNDGGVCLRGRGADGTGSSFEDGRRGLEGERRLYDRRGGVDG